jgi:hypothetical protein
MDSYEQASRQAAQAELSSFAEGGCITCHSWLWRGFQRMGVRSTWVFLWKVNFTKQICLMILTFSKRSGILLLFSKQYCSMILGTHGFEP